ncbi:acyl transferase/acyl hydrolase/lysophospholipase [Phycomyces nitens]|nr:acyl transferase/acyl hydrolase/lysophospholipase [Phycomyces nitens]
MPTKAKHNKNRANEFDIEYVNEDHVAAFVKALAQDPFNSENAPEHISASSQLMPVRKKLPRKERRLAREQEAITPNGISQSLLRYPLIICIGFTILVELLLYICLRQIVRVWESSISWRGKRRQLRNKLREAESYEEWCTAADALDRYMGKDEWKTSAPYGFYDYRLIQKIIQHLKKYRQSDDPEDAFNLKDVLYACLKQNFAGIENAKLYSNTYLGTKVLVEEYVNEVTRSIDVLARSPHLSSKDKLLAFKLYSRNYGRTAFCLSGGAGFGYYHLGVIRALLDRNLLPSIITGTSAGSLLGAIVCTRTDEELRQVLVPGLADRIHIANNTLVERVKSYFKTGAIFDSEKWCREAMWYTRGSMTFKEAYERTGRIYNVSVVPSDAHSPPKLLNYITAPDCVIWSAVLASAAIPGVLNAVVLMQKAKNGQLIPYNYGHRFKDGSLRTDIPSQTLHNYFNVNYTVVSQVNPHIHLFFYAPQGSPGRPVTHLNGKGWRGGFLASTMEQLLKLELSKWLKVLRDLDLLPKLLNQDWSSIWLQKFDGNVTILPKSKLSDWLYLIADPNEDRLKNLFRVGELRTWPKITMISNRMRIENAIELNRKALKNTHYKMRHQIEGPMSDDAFQKQIQTLQSQMKDGLVLGSGTSDECSGSEGDEQKFLKSRRPSIVSSGNINEQEIQKEEETRRRKFLAQFSDRREVIDGHEIVADANLQTDSESSSS